MPPTLKTIAATWLSLGHPGPLCFHMGCRQHSLLAIKIEEDKRQTASTSWQILICKQALFIYLFPLKTGDFIGEKLKKVKYYEVNSFISEEIDLKHCITVTLVKIVLGVCVPCHIL